MPPASRVIDQLLCCDVRAHSLYLGGQRIPGDFVVSEHAGFLQLPWGVTLFVDELQGALVVVDADRAAADAVVAQIPVAVPSEHLAVDETGRHVAVTTGLGAAEEPWSGVVTVVDLEPARCDIEGSADGAERARARRFRTRVGEPGVVITGRGTDTRLVLRHREPGALETLPLAEAMGVETGVPRLEGRRIPGVCDAAHGDLLVPGTDEVLVAGRAGVQEWHVDAGGAQLHVTHPWQTNGRAYYLRWVPDARCVVTAVRDDTVAPEHWHRWQNVVWCLDVRTGDVSTADLGPGLVFRCAPVAGGVAFARVHPDGDEVIVVDVPSMRVRHRVDLPALGDPPRPGESPWEHGQRRSLAADPEGAVVAVTSGGDGVVHLVDVAAGRLLDPVGLSTDLAGGGLLTWCGGGRLDQDTVGR